MVFRPGALAWPLAEIPDSIPICDFMLDDRYGRRPIAESLDPFVCGISGKSISAPHMRDRVNDLAKGLAHHVGWKVNQGTEFDKAAVIFAPDNIDTLPISWAIHRLNGLSSPANAVYSAEELHHQVKTSGATILFTVPSLLPVAMKAASKSNIDQDHIIMCEMPGEDQPPDGVRTISDLMEQGRTLPDLDPLRWTTAQGRRQTAFLCFSSGTSGAPKAVMISHFNVIANVKQIQPFEQPSRDAIKPGYLDVILGLMPFSHIYCLVGIAHISVYRGDSIVVLPKFVFKDFLGSIEKYKINTLSVVPPIIINLVRNKVLCDQFDLTSVRSVMTGAAPLGKETAQEFASQHPDWVTRQGYGMTETATAVTNTSPMDVWFGSSGCLLSGVEAKVLSPEGVEITEYNKPGELLVKAPSIVLGYLNNPKANAETFIDMPDGRFLKTGNEVEFRVSPAGNEHLWVVDRIKELIKVKVR